MTFRPAPSVNSKVSAVLSAVWRVAAKEARQADCAEIDLPQLLIGIFSLAKLQTKDFQVNDLKEHELALKLLSACFARRPEVRKALRLEVAKAVSSRERTPSDNSAEKIARSECIKQLFREAMNNDHPATVCHILKAIVERQPQALEPFLIVSQEELRSAVAATCQELEALEVGAQEAGSLALSIDARTIEHLPVVNQAFAELIYSVPEWIAGENYHSACGRLIDLFPKADSVAIVIANQEGHLLLKSGWSARDLKFSLRIVRKVMSSEQAEIWLRDESTESLLNSAGDTACAMYCPILAEGVGIGAVYLGSVARGPVFGEQHLKQLSAIARQLGTCVENQRLRRNLEQQNRVLQRLLTNFSPAVRSRLLEMAGVGQLRLGGVRSEVSILCSDIRGFTQMSSNLDAEDVVDLLNDYFSVMVECIFNHGGTIDKFIGDAILAVFGSPVPDPNHRLHAAEAALAMQRAIHELNVKRQSRGDQVCQMGIGVHCGEVLHGFIGSRDRMEYTVIGDTVNVTSRLCDGAGPSEIVISRALHEHIWQEVACEQCEVPTKHEGRISAYQLHSKKVKSKY